jgi:hypothetical protein
MFIVISGGREVESFGLSPLDSCDSGFESLWGHQSLVFVVST